MLRSTLTLLCVVAIGCSEDMTEPPPRTDAEACFADLLDGDIPGDVHHFVSDDATLRVSRARELIGFAAGRSNDYAPLRVWIDGPHEPGLCVIELSALDYIATHHNWDDEWSATTSTARYAGREEHQVDGTWHDTLTVHADDGTVLETYTLIDDGCQELGDGFSYRCVATGDDG